MIQTKRTTTLQLSTDKKNAVLQTMAELLESNRAQILELNKAEVEAYEGGDQAMYDRLKVNDKKVDGMIGAVQMVKNGEDPTGRLLYEHTKDNGLKIMNKTVPFGSILIIYESRPDVTIEAASLAFKAGNKILLKGGKEARNTNKKLVEIWNDSLIANGVSTDWITYLDFNREQTQAFLRQPDKAVDLIVPRGGEKLIAYVKAHATVPVIVSGRGNNFLYVHEAADLEKAKQVIVNGKTQKISACNALDKVLFDPKQMDFAKQLALELQELGVEVLGDKTLSETLDIPQIESEAVWAEEFLSMKIVLGISETIDDAIDTINTHCGGHSVVIMTEDTSVVDGFMNAIDATAIYHNASTRFTDGGQFGLGAELGISTEKLHHRGPLGLEALVTNKWFVYGNGQVRV